MLTLSSIESAAARIAGDVHESPLVYTETLSALTGKSIYLKLENIVSSLKESGYEFSVIE